jgi:signal peptidase I
MWFFTPTRLKRAKNLRQNLERFLNYKRDLLNPADVDSIKAMDTELAALIRRRAPKEELEALSKTIQDTCLGLVAPESNSNIREQVEMVFVVVAILLGFKSYIVQPFKIPTNSMLPTLNGVVATYTDEETPAFLNKGWQMIMAGSRFVEYHAEGPLNIANLGVPLFEPAETEQDRGAQKLEQSRIIEKTVKGLGAVKAIGFFNYSELTYDDGTTSSFYMPPSRVAQLILQTARATGKFQLQKGDLLARGWVKTGDHVMVNKFAYHFRAPIRGEVFVFTTKNLSTGSTDSRGKPVVQHYIKRLVGLPGDKLTISQPELLINDQKAVEPGIRRVIDSPADSGYKGYSQVGTRSVYSIPTADPIHGGQPGFWAMGDNSYNSRDSRYFGAIPQSNLVGPALIAYWPIFPHFGWIR